MPMDQTALLQQQIAQMQNMLSQAQGRAQTDPRVMSQGDAQQKIANGLANGATMTPEQQQMAMMRLTQGAGVVGREQGVAHMLAKQDGFNPTGDNRQQRMLSLLNQYFPNGQQAPASTTPAPQQGTANSAYNNLNTTLGISSNLTPALTSAPNWGGMTPQNFVSLLSSFPGGLGGLGGVGANQNAGMAPTQMYGSGSPNPTYQTWGQSNGTPTPTNGWGNSNSWGSGWGSWSSPFKGTV